MPSADLLMEELEKRKVSATNLYLLCLRQIMENQVALLTGTNGFEDVNAKGRSAENTIRLIHRIDSYIENRE